MARGGQHPHPHPAADRDHVPIGDAGPVEGHLVGGVDVVSGPGSPRESKTASDVVVVHVRLEHVADRHSQPGRQRQHPVDVTLRVHHKRPLPVVHQIASIAQRRSVNGDDLHGRRCLSTHATLSLRPGTTGKLPSGISLAPGT